MEPKQKEYPAVDVTSDRSKVWCCKEQYCIGTWNVRSMNQGKLVVVKQEMARVNVDILGISELKWTTAAKLLQSCPTLWDPIDGSPPGSPVPGTLQARTLEWVAISFSNAGKWKVKVKSLTHVWPSATPWTAAYQAPLSMGFSRQEYLSGLPFPSPVTVLHTYNYFLNIIISNVFLSFKWLKSSGLKFFLWFFLMV